MKRLSELKTGERSIIRKVEGGSSYLKLLEMGCVTGSELMVVHKAPFGGPIAVIVSGYKLSLRVEDAATIYVESPSGHIST